ncbi:MAG: galactokinase [Desulfobacterales bacterium]|jgi:D-glycero-alpha-D-manno-heptose-7-phosphate kinase
MTDKLKCILEKEPIVASAPCRIDMGGTLDIRTFYYPLRHLAPCTFNIAVALRTRVRLLPYHGDLIRISSKGFKSAEFPSNRAPFAHSLGLMFAIAVYFKAANIHIQIESESPPRGALGGSSAAAVALIAAFSKLMEKTTSNKPLTRSQIAVLAHGLEESVAGVPCGFQDQLAAVYGGVNAWMWPVGIEAPQFRKKRVLPKAYHKDIEKHLLLAYCGKPHESSDINGRWVQQFLSGKFRDLWSEITLCTRQFIRAMSNRNYSQAVVLMNKETEIRKKMTPDVLDQVGSQLFDTAVLGNCGARFTGAGGGGCVWALGEIKHIDRLKPMWEDILSTENEGRLLDMKIDSRGLVVH